MRFEIVFALVIAAHAASAANYEIVDLARFKSADGFVVSRPNDINNNGEVVGDASNPATGEKRAFRWREGKVEQLGLFASGKWIVLSSANRINDAGIAVGHATKGSVIRPAVWEPGKAIRELDLPISPNPEEFSGAKGISNNGIIVGNFYPGQYNQAFMWVQGRLTALGTLGKSDKGVSASYAVAVNDQGQVIGQSSHPQGFRAFLWENGRMRELPALPEHQGDGSSVVARAINSAGQIAGCSGNQSKGGFGPVMWNQDGSVVKLAEPEKNSAGVKQGCANGINAKGAVVGHISTTRGDVAFVWNSSTGLKNLNDLADPSVAGWKRLADAHAINDREEIVGLAEKEGGIPTQPFLLRPRGAGQLPRR